MRFQGLMLLRDEEDIIAQNLDHLLTWVDNLYVLDLGSTDRTWEIVNDYARREPRIVPYLHKPIIYNDNLRSVLFDHFRDRFSPGDWVMKIDADEFYHVPPPQFVRERVRAGETAVYLLWYYFRLTRAEVEAYENGTVNEAEDRQRSITERRRFYQIATYSEPRMFKYRRSMQWPESTSFPYNAGYVARERIPIRHYPHRDVSQMIRRFELRSAMMKFKSVSNVRHWKLTDWRADLFVPDGPVDAKQGVATMAGLDTGTLHEWKPGEPLPDLHPTNHLPPAKTRLMQRMVHPLLLPLLDRRRPRYDRQFQPALIPQETAGG
jgi:glycosyltransferase involved in cell wall biosynthesis